MGLYNLLQQRKAINKPVRVGVIGAGTFSSAFITQARITPGMQIVGIAELDLPKAKRVCISAGWPEDAITFGDSSSVINDGAAVGKVTLTGKSDELLQAELDVIVEATGITEVGIHHAFTAMETGKHVVMVNVETEALLGLALKKKASEKGVVCSLAYGDQPAIICELIDWARTIGAEIVCAGKGTRYQPEYHYSTPDTVWKHFGFSQEQLASGNYNPQMYNSFLDGTKSAIEMCAVANAAGLVPPKNGLHFFPVGADRLPEVLKPKADGGILEHSGTVEVVASENRDGTPVKNHLRWGLYIVFRPLTGYMRRYLSMHEFLSDTSGQYMAVYRPFHLTGLELGMSVASAALRGEATGAASYFMADVAAVAKKDLKPGDILDGEGGYTVYGRLVQSAESVPGSYLPVGLGRGGKVVRPVAKDSFITYDDVKMDTEQLAFKIRRKLEAELKATKR